MKRIRGRRLSSKKFGDTQVHRFVVIGILNSALSYALYLSLLAILSYRLAYSITYLMGILLGYVLNAKWVFITRVSVRSALLYPAAYIVNYLLGVACLWLLVESFGVAQNFAPLLILVVTVPSAYMMNKAVFNRTGTRNAQPNN